MGAAANRPEEFVEEQAIETQVYGGLTVPLGNVDGSLLVHFSNKTCRPQRPPLCIPNPFEFEDAFE